MTFPKLFVLLCILKNRKMIETGRILPGKILCKEPPKVEKKTTSGIIIPETTKSPTIIGDVVLTGESLPTLKMVVSDGDKVLFSPHSFVRVVIDDEPYMLVNLQDILFIF